MKRIVASLVLLVALGVVIGILVENGNDGGGPYTVRAIFDNASSVVTGEDVRISGAPVGSIVSEDVTSDKKAALTLEIDNSAFVPFRSNARCTIRVQSVIGEKFVDCSAGTASHPALTKIHSGPGAGAHYLPVTNTHSPVDFDIVQNIYREPVRQQFALILNELGTGLAARGADLNAVIRRADPALGYTDRVLKILAHQNRQLADLATNSNRVLAPLARLKSQLTGFVIHANTTSVASAARAADTARSFHLLPEFLRQLRPLMVDLGQLADQGTPVFNTLSQAAPSINSQYENLAAFARATHSALINLGASAQAQQPALLATIPLDRQLERLGTSTLPSAKLLDRLLSSLKTTGGIQQLMALLVNGTGATNGFDSAGHYIRTESLFGSCTPYAKVPVPGCSANFVNTAAADVARTPTRPANDRAAAAAQNRPTVPAARNHPALTASGREVQKPPLDKNTQTFSSLLSYLIGAGR